MDNKFYVSLEAEELLIEKGYNEKCNVAYTDISNGSDINGRIAFNSNDYPIGIYPCPTKAEAIDWLESKGITIEVHRNSWKGYVEWKYYILEKGHREFLYLTRLEAEEAAIIKALELL